MVEIDHELCVGCAFCARDCPAGAIALFFGKARVNATVCTGCGQCLEVCPTGAIDWRGKETRRKVPERVVVRQGWSGWSSLSGRRGVIPKRDSVRSNINELRQRLEDLKEKAEEIVTRIESL